MRAVNLIPSEQRSSSGLGTRSGGAAFFVLGLLGGLAVLALLYGRAHHDVATRRAEAATLSQRAQEIQQQASRLSPYASFMAMREERLHAVAQLIGSRFDWSNTMTELSRVLPSDVVLSTVQGSIGATESTGPAPRAATAAAAATAVSSATPPGSTPTLTLTGCAASQSVVAQTLVRLRLIAGVSTVALQSSTKSGSSGSCSSKAPVFNIQMTFQALPTPSAATTAALSASGSKTGTSNSSAPGASGAAASGSARGSSATYTTGTAR